MVSSKGRILGLFPSFDAIGGVQASGEVAWQGIVETFKDGYPDGGFRKPHLLVYGDHSKHQNKEFHKLLAHSTSRLNALVNAIRLREPIKIAVVWHLDILKLLPFLDLRHARVALFLHGIEAWKRHHWVYGHLLSRVQLFLSNSDYTWDRFLHLNRSYSLAPHLTVHLGLLSEHRGNLPPAGSPPTVLMLGRLEENEDYKGHREMISAWPLVLQSVPEAELWIAGDGSLRKQLEQLVAKRHLIQSVRFWGQVSEAQKQALLAHCRCLALPSRNEGFGLVYLEAMRLGRPCLVSTSDAGREVVNPPEAGLAVDPTDEKELARSVCHFLMGGPCWDALSQRARQRYESNFTANHFKTRLVRALNLTAQPCAE